MPRKVVLLMGPPGAGKDTLADHLVDAFPGRVVKHEFKARLVELLLEAYTLSPVQWGILQRRENKERPSELLHGRSPRQALIHLSEEVIKPREGKDYFAREFVRLYLGQDDDRIVVASDCGFAEEIELAGAVCECLVVHVHRPGHTFAGDSRNYHTAGRPAVELHNDSTPEAVCAKISQLVRDWI